jgi:septal ring factor EnvC (AmiA/AmiB activator)
VLIKSIEQAFMHWLDSKVKLLVNKRIGKLMITVSEVQAKIAELEAAIVAERGQVTNAIEAYTARIAELIDAASASGQDLSVLITDLERVEAEIKAIYAPPEVVAP